MNTFGLLIAFKRNSRAAYFHLAKDAFSLGFRLGNQNENQNQSKSLTPILAKVV